MTLFGVIDATFAASGLCVGVLVGLTGVGGGSLMTPLLVLFFGLEPRAAVGTDLLYAALTKAVGSAAITPMMTATTTMATRPAAGGRPADERSSQSPNVNTADAAIHARI